MKSALSKLARFFGFEASGFPATPDGCTNLYNQWTSQIRSTGQTQVIFDVGANRGQTITRFRKEFPESTIYAFEPGPTAFAGLQAGTKNDPKVKLFKFALGEHDGSATLHENENDVTNSLLPNSSRIFQYAPEEMCAPKRTCTVPVMRIDSICQTESIRCIDVLKIDAQGYEKHILAGAGNLLNPATVRSLFLEVLFVELYEKQAWCGEILELLRTHGYRLFGLTGIKYDHVHGWMWADAMFLQDKPVNQQPAD